jgi:hypothetical protein
MGVTNLDSVQNQIQKFWSPLFTEELRATALLPSLVNKAYQGEIKQKNDTVRVSQIVAPTGSNRTVGVNADTFESEELQTLYVDVKADKRAVVAVEFTDLVSLQSQIEAEINGGEASPLRMALVHAVNMQMNAHLYSLVAPSTASPDHLIGSVSDFNKSQILALRLLKAKAMWSKIQGGAWILADPSYYGDLLNDTTLNNADYVGDKPTVGGQIATPRYGFNILEDETLATDQAVAFHPDFLHLVKQTEIQFKISDLHSQKKFGYLISADIVYGAKLGIAGNVKHILVNSGSATSVVMA